MKNSTSVCDGKYNKKRRACACERVQRNRTTKYKRNCGRGCWNIARKYENECVCLFVICYLCFTICFPARPHPYTQTIQQETNNVLKITLCIGFDITDASNLIFSETNAKFSEKFCYAICYLYGYIDYSHTVYST